MFQASRKEWTELVALMRCVGEGAVPLATEKGQPVDEEAFRLREITRLEEQGVRHYRREADQICITAPERAELRFDLELWNDAAAHAVQLLRESDNENLVEVDDAMEAFLDDAEFQSIGGTGEGQHHLVLHFDTLETGLAIVLSRIGAHPTRLLDGGRSANMKLEQTGTRFATPMVTKVNSLETEHSIRDRMAMVKQMGSSLRYVYAADRVFRANLALIDLHLGRLLTEMLRCSYEEEILRVDELTAVMRELNPLKVSQELIDKHRYYEHKLSQLLLACLAGMRPAKIYHGETSMPPYVLLLSTDGQLQMFRSADRERLAKFLLRNTRLLRGSTEKDKYGLLERENGVYYFKLNLKIGLTKR